MENIRQFLREYIGVKDNDLLECVASVCSIRSLKKGEMLIEQDQPMKGMCFLISGLLRGYILSHDGKDVTDCFGFRRGAAAMPYADILQPSPIHIEALEDSEVLIIPMQVLQGLLSNTDVLQIYNRLLLGGAAEHWDIKIALYQYSAVQRYNWFIERYEGLIDRVPHRHVASFLGMSPVTLSRIRKTLRDSGK